MGLSETIVAAIIGALATMGTAIFQLIRNRAPSDSRPKKNRVRSVFATIALMIGCIVGGYAWSALRAVSAREEMQAAMRAELAEFAALQARQNAAALKQQDTDASGATVSAHNGEAGLAESLAHLPPCRINTTPEDVGPVTCSESVAQPIALCAAVPAASMTTNVRVQARVPKSEAGWEERDAGATTLGSLRIGAAASEYPVNPELRSVCLDVSNWSVEDTLAVRLIVEYSFANPPASELTAAAPGAHSL
jgi:hypothetical protein